MTTISAADYQAMQKCQKKPIKQSQGSNANKLPPLPEVRTAGPPIAQNGYSEVKQDALNQIQELYRQADEQLCQIPKERYNIDSPEVWTFMRMCRSAIEIVKLLKI